MNALFLAYLPVLDLFLLYCGYAFSQYVVLHAGVFSLATAGFAAVGAYTAAIGMVRYGLNPYLALLLACVMGGMIGLLLSWPLARLRGVYQAIATLAFVQILLSLNLYLDNFTGGAMGINGIPKVVGTAELAICAIVTFYLLSAIDATRIGRAFQAIRQDETVAMSLGISIRFYQGLAFIISGAIAGLFGGLEALHSYSLEPNQFGFGMLVTVLSYVVFGGRRSIYGPVFGVGLLILLPELARPLAENRLLAYGVVLMLVIALMPRGIVDTVADYLRRRSISSAKSSAKAVSEVCG